MNVMKGIPMKDKRTKAQLLEELDGTNEEFRILRRKNNALEKKLKVAETNWEEFKKGMAHANGQLSSLQACLFVLIAGQKDLSKPSSDTCKECGSYKNNEEAPLTTLGLQLLEARNSIQFHHIVEEKYEDD